MFDSEDQGSFKFAMDVAAAPGVSVVRQVGGGVLLKPGKLKIRGSVMQAAKILGVSRRTVLRMIQDGTVSARKPRMNGSPNCKYVVDLIPVYAMAEREV